MNKGQSVIKTIERFKEFAAKQNKEWDDFYDSLTHEERETLTNFAIERDARKWPQLEQEE